MAQGIDLIAEFERRCRYYRPATEETKRLHEEVRTAITKAGVALITVCPEGRELSLAMTKLEEAMMWGNASIARNRGSEGDRT